VGGHQLLLLTHRPEEADGVDAEAHHTHNQHHQQAHHGCNGRAPTLTPTWGAKHQERQQQAGCQLDSHPRRQCSRPRAKPWRLTRAQRQSARHRQQHERVIVGAPHRQDEQHRVQSHERSRPAG